MGFLVSPGVEVKEIDLTNVIPAVSTSIGGFVGEFRWGPAGEAVTVSSEKELASVFGAPTDAFARSFMTAASFLKYGNALKVSRALGVGASNASSSGDADLTNPLVKNYSDFLAQEGSLRSDGYQIVARYPGSIANGLEVRFAACGGSISSDFSSYVNSGTTGISEFSSGQKTTDSQGSEIKDEITVLIIDGQGIFSGSAGSVLEVWEGLSVISDAKKADGSALYYRDVINKNSSYIYIAEELDGTYGFTASEYYGLNGNVAVTAPTSVTDNDSITIGLDNSGGEPGSDGILPDYFTASEVFADGETIDVNLLFTVDNGETGYSSGEDAILTIAKTRKDCIAFISAPIAISNMTADLDRFDAVFDKFSDQSATRSSYAVWDSTPLYVYNKYTDKYLWIPACGHMAGLCANTDSVAEPWFSPAGYNRGNLFGVTRIAFNPKQDDRDELYKLGVNPIVAFPGQGILLFGDKTAQAKPSAFDRINVRRLFITLEKAISTAAKYQLFELNDEFTRAMFRNMVEPFLRDVKGRRGVTDFLVVCDETNNTGEVIDTNRFVADIYIKPARSINFITLNFIATRTGVEFSELVGK